MATEIDIPNFVCSKKGESEREDNALLSEILEATVTELDGDKVKELETISQVSDSVNTPLESGKPMDESETFLQALSVPTVNADEHSSNKPDNSEAAILEDQEESKTNKIEVLTEEKRNDDESFQVVASKEAFVNEYQPIMGDHDAVEIISGKPLVKEACDETGSEKAESDEGLRLSDGVVLNEEDAVSKDEEKEQALNTLEKEQGDAQDLNGSPREILDESVDTQEASKLSENETEVKGEQKPEERVDKLVQGLKDEESTPSVEIKEKVEQSELLHVISTQTESQVETTKHEERKEEEVIQSEKEKSETPLFKEVCEETSSENVESEQGIKLSDNPITQLNETEIASKDATTVAYFAEKDIVKDTTIDPQEASQKCENEAKDETEEKDEEIVESGSEIKQEDDTEETKPKPSDETEENEEEIIGQKESSESLLVKEVSEEIGSEKVEYGEEVKISDGSSIEIEEKSIAIVSKDEGEESQQAVNKSEKDQGEDDINEPQVVKSKGCTEEDTQGTRSSIEEAKENEEKNDEVAFESDDSLTNKSESAVVKEACEEIVSEKVAESEQELKLSDSSSKALNENEIASKVEDQEKEQEPYVLEKDQTGGDDVIRSQNAFSEDIKETNGQDDTTVVHSEEAHALNEMPKDILKEEAEDATLDPQEASEKCENEAKDKSEQKPEEETEELKPSVGTEEKTEQQELLHANTIDLENAEHEEKIEEAIKNNDGQTEKSDPLITEICEESHIEKAEPEGENLSDDSSIKQIENAIEISSKDDDQEKEQELNKSDKDQSEESQVENMKHAEKNEQEVIESENGRKESSDIPLVKEVCEETNSENVESEKEVKLQTLDATPKDILKEEADETTVDPDEAIEKCANATEEESVNTCSEIKQDEDTEEIKPSDEKVIETFSKDEDQEKDQSEDEVCIPTKTESQVETIKHEEKNEEEVTESELGQKGSSDSPLVKEACEATSSEKVEYEKEADEKEIATLIKDEDQESQHEVNTSQDATCVKETTAQAATTMAYTEEAHEINAIPKDILNETTIDPQEASEQSENAATDEIGQKPEEIVHPSSEIEREGYSEELKPSEETEEKKEHEGLTHDIITEACTSTQTESQVESQLETKEHEEKNEEVIPSDEGQKEKSLNPLIKEVCEESEKVELEGVEVSDNSIMKQNEKEITTLIKDEDQEKEQDLNTSEEAKNYDDEGKEPEFNTTRESIEEDTDVCISTQTESHDEIPKNEEEEAIENSDDGQKEKSDSVKEVCETSYDGEANEPEVYKTTESIEKVSAEKAEATTTDALTKVIESQVETIDHEEKKEEEIIESDNGEKENSESPLVKEVCEETSSKNIEYKEEVQHSGIEINEKSIESLSKDNDQESPQEVNMSEEVKGEGTKETTIGQHVTTVAYPEEDQTPSSVPKEILKEEEENKSIDAQEANNDGEQKPDESVNEIVHSSSQIEQEEYIEEINLSVENDETQKENSESILIKEVCEETQSEKVESESIEFSEKSDIKVNEKDIAILVKNEDQMEQELVETKESIKEDNEVTETSVKTEEITEQEKLVQTESQIETTQYEEKKEESIEIVKEVCEEISSEKAEVEEGVKSSDSSNIKLNEKAIETFKDEDQEVKSEEDLQEKNDEPELVITRESVKEDTEETTNEIEEKNDEEAIENENPMVKEVCEEVVDDSQSLNRTLNENEIVIKEESQEKEEEVKKSEEVKGGEDAVISSQTASSKDIKEETIGQQTLSSMHKEILKEEPEEKSTDAQAASEQSEDGAKDKIELNPEESVKKPIDSCPEIIEENIKEVEADPKNNKEEVYIEKSNNEESKTAGGTQNISPENKDEATDDLTKSTEGITQDVEKDNVNEEVNEKHFYVTHEQKSEASEQENISEELQVEVEKESQKDTRDFKLEDFGSEIPCTTTQDITKEEFQESQSKSNEEIEVTIDAEDQADITEDTSEMKDEVVLTEKMSSELEQPKETVTENVEEVHACVTKTTSENTEDEITNKDEDLSHAIIEDTIDNASVEEKCFQDEKTREIDISTLEHDSIEELNGGLNEVSEEKSTDLNETTPEDTSNSGKAKAESEDLPIEDSKKETETLETLEPHGECKLANESVTDDHISEEIVPQLEQTGENDSVCENRDMEEDVTQKDQLNSTEDCSEIVKDTEEIEQVPLELHEEKETNDFKAQIVEEDNTSTELPKTSQNQEEVAHEISYSDPIQDAEDTSYESKTSSTIQELKTVIEEDTKESVNIIEDEAPKEERIQALEDSTTLEPQVDLSNVESTACQPESEKTPTQDIQTPEVVVADSQDTKVDKECIVLEEEEKIKTNEISSEEKKESEQVAENPSTSSIDMVVIEEGLGKPSEHEKTIDVGQESVADQTISDNSPQDTEEENVKQVHTEIEEAKSDLITEEMDLTKESFELHGELKQVSTSAIEEDQVNETKSQPEESDMTSHFLEIEQVAVETEEEKKIDEVKGQVSEEDTRPTKLDKISTSNQKELSDEIEYSEPIPVGNTEVTEVEAESQTEVENKQPAEEASSTTETSKVEINEYIDELKGGSVDEASKDEKTPGLEDSKALEHEDNLPEVESTDTPSNGQKTIEEKDVLVSQLAAREILEGTTENIEETPNVEFENKETDDELISEIQTPKAILKTEMKEEHLEEPSNTCETLTSGLSSEKLLEKFKEGDAKEDIEVIVAQEEKAIEDIYQDTVAEAKALNDSELEYKEDKSGNEVIPEVEKGEDMTSIKDEASCVHNQLITATDEFSKTESLNASPDELLETKGSVEDTEDPKLMAENLNIKAENEDVKKNVVETREIVASEFEKLENIVTEENITEADANNEKGTPAGDITKTISGLISSSNEENMQKLEEKPTGVSEMTSEVAKIVPEAKEVSTILTENLLEASTKMIQEKQDPEITTTIEEIEDEVINKDETLEYIKEREAVQPQELISDIKFEQSDLDTKEATLESINQENQIEQKKKADENKENEIPIEKFSEKVEKADSVETEERAYITETIADLHHKEKSDETNCEDTSAEAAIPIQDVKSSDVELKSAIDAPTCASISNLEVKSIDLEVPSGMDETADKADYNKDPNDKIPEKYEEENGVLKEDLHLESTYDKIKTTKENSGMNQEPLELDAHVTPNIAATKNLEISQKYVTDDLAKASQIQPETQKYEVSSCIVDEQSLNKPQQNESMESKLLTGKTDALYQQVESTEKSLNVEAKDLKTANASGTEPDSEVLIEEKKMNDEKEKSEPPEPTKMLSADISHETTKGNSQVAENLIEKRELDLTKIQQVDKEETDEENEEEDNEDAQKMGECSDAPVMVEASKDMEVKVHKKSHNILSGVGSKVKHSIAKVKKAITGKSSQPKPPSPKDKDQVSTQQDR